MTIEANQVRGLEQERAALDHELRRLRDRLLRNSTAELQREEKRLLDAIALCDRDLASARPAGKADER